MPASLNYRQLDPWGSHPLTDPLWSNGCTKLLPEGGGARRIDKILAIAQEPLLMDNLIVCWADPNGNCGRCDKCLRTRIALRALGVSVPTFEPLTSVQPLKKISAQTPVQLAFLLENLEYARKNRDHELVKVLTSVLRRMELRQALVSLDEVILRGAIRKTYRKLRPPDPRPDRVTFDFRRPHITDLS